MAENGRVAAAGGMFVQMLPSPDGECLEKLEDILFFMDALTLIIQDAGGDPRKMLDIIFNKMPDEFKPEILEERSINWHCGCSKERMEKALISIGEKDLSSLISEDHSAELTCQFCRSKYSFNEQELEALLREAQN